MLPWHCFYNDLANEKPAIAISACLLGDAVRYDGQHKDFPLVAGFFRQHAKLVKVCPEVGAGLGVPRPAVALHDTAEGIRALGVGNVKLDVTVPLTAFSHDFARQHQQAFQAVIVKSRSPSCGYGSTPIQGAAQENRFGNGIFSQTLSQEWPQCLVIEESRLSSESLCLALLFRCYILLDINNTEANKLPLLQAHYARWYTGDLSLPAIAAVTMPFL